MRNIDPEAVRKTADLLDIFGNTSRLSIAAHLEEKEMSVGDLAEAVGISVSGISQHLTRMKAHGFVVPRRDAQTVYYRLVGGPVVKAALGLLEGAREPS